MARPGLLFVAPLFPAAQGIGLAMRGWRFLESYARTHDVHLLVIPVIGDGGGHSNVESLTRSVQILEFDPHLHALAKVMSVQMPEGSQGPDLPSLCAYPVIDAWNAVARLMDGVNIDVVHVQRLYMAPTIRSLLE